MNDYEKREERVAKHIDKLYDKLEKEEDNNSLSVLELVIYSSSIIIIFLGIIGGLFFN